MINLQNVSFSYNNEKVLSNISFHIEKGGFTAFIGSNGAGKSTLCRIMNGLIKPSSGTVTVNGMDTRTTKSSILARHIGFLFQNPDRQICKNTVGEEIRFSLDIAFTDKNMIEKRLIETLSLFDFDADSNPFHLSRGERQQVALASIIAAEPEILILDEPTTGLDYVECMKIMSIIKKLNDKGITIIMVCHDMEIVLDFAQRVLVLAEGRLIADGKTREIFLMEEILRQASLLPPQVARLAARVGFDDVFYVDEMTDIVLKRIKNRRKRTG